ncbi:F0F1 ATP synthase subunit delta, partial [bacterium]|nr:F0F1 ATP synthase subunit delta [bacterium]
MADNAVAGYADALFAVAEANGVLLTVEDELFRFSQALNSDENLQATLDDSSLPVDRRQQIVEDLLEGSACPTTKALVSMVVA